MSGRPIKRTLRRTAASGMPIIKRVLRISCADVGCSSSIIPAVRLPLACSSGSSRRSRCATGTRPGTSPRTGSPARAAGCSRRRSTCSHHHAVDDPSRTAIRPAVVMRKVCGGNRSVRGAQTQQVLTSVLRTTHQRGLDPAGLLATILRAPTPSVPPSLQAPPP